MNDRVINPISALVLGLAALAGCGRSEGIETARVYGVVSLDGQPYTQGGWVQFTPQFAAKMAGGRIQSDGSYELSTYALGDGAAVGSHQVAVVPAISEGDDDFTEEIRPAPIQSAIPKKYQSAKTSGLVFEVKPGQSNEFPIEMKSK